MNGILGHKWLQGPEATAEHIKKEFAERIESIKKVREAELKKKSDITEK
jgi:hypothetical protein